MQAKLLSAGEEAVAYMGPHSSYARDVRTAFVAAVRVTAFDACSFGSAAGGLRLFSVLAPLVQLPAAGW
jgi:hypothetical protein